MWDLTFIQKSFPNNVFQKKAVSVLPLEAEAELDTVHLRGKLLKSLAEALSFVISIQISNNANEVFKTKCF